MEFQKIVAGVDFDYEEDKHEFGRGDRIALLNRFADDEGQDVIGITFHLGRKKDDIMNLILPYKEFIDKVASLTVEH